MDKISSEQIAEVLSDASLTIRAQQAKIAEYEEVLNARGLRDRATKIASDMHRKGLELDTPIGQLVDRLEKAAGQNKLDAYETAVDLVGPDMGTKLASINNDETRISAGSSDLERYVMGTTG